MAVSRVPVSIVCVANDEAVRSRCLDMSIAERLHEAPATEYLPVDNRGGAFASAGAALNHGARQARHDHVAFVHQDVCLHSLAALERAAGVLAADPGIGMVGAAGIAADGRIVGRVRDRVVLIGDRVGEPTDVDSVDEVLFVVPRATVLREPLSEDPELAWHAYAVEYGLRLRALGKRVTVGDVPLTHNSLTINVDRLDVAHRAVAARHPGALPLRTTCGTITAGPPPRPHTGPLAAQRWRYRWLRESLVAHRVRRAVGGGPVVLSDPRHDFDEALAGFDGPIEVLNLERGQCDPPRELVRGERTLTVAALPAPRLAKAVAGWRPGRSLLLTNLEVDDLRALARIGPPAPRVLGHHDETGCWLLIGEAARQVPSVWTSPRATPFAMAPLRAALEIGGSIAPTSTARP